MSEDIFGFAQDDFEGDEINTGIGGEDVHPKQVSVVGFEKAEFRRSKNKDTAGIHATVRLDEKDAMTPKKSFFLDYYLTEGNKGQVNALFKYALGWGRITANLDGPKAEVDALGKALAAKLASSKPKVIMFVGVSVDKSGQYPDKNQSDGVHPINERNLAAIREAGYDYARVAKKEKRQGDKVVDRWLEVKKGGVKKAATTTSAAPAVID